MREYSRLTSLTATDILTFMRDTLPAEVRQFCELDETSRALMRSAMNQLQLSARAYHRILKLARTIADLAGSENIQPAHLDGSYPALLASLAKLDLLILDDWMRDPLTASEARDLLEVFDDRFGRVSTLVASQVPVADWFARLPDPTIADSILDRIIHNSYRLTLTGDSQRKTRAAVPMPSI